MSIQFFWLCVLYYVFVNQLQVESVQVTTQNGIVEGTKLPSGIDGVNYFGFMGIPYAKPPLGNLRFQPPQLPSNWSGVRNATYERDICVQTQNLVQVIGSEDCLFINVFTAQLPQSTNSSLFPVMVWIHGGAFIGGSGSHETQGPGYLVKEGVVVVSLNYRLGVFGFLSTEDMLVPGNNGLKDQIMALHWVKGNIAQFGGNPNKVTIFGISAGGASVSYLVQSHLSAGLYHGAIIQSGTTLSLWSLSRNGRQFAFDVGRRLLIFTNNSNTLVTALRNVNYVLLQSVSVTLVSQVSIAYTLNGLEIAPVKEPEHAGAVFTSRSYELLRKGTFNQVPIIVGYTSEEGNGFALSVNLLRLNLVSYDINRSQLVPIDMNIANDTTKAFVGQEIHSHYVGASGSLLTSDTGYIHYMSDNQFVRATHQYTKLVSHHVSTYYYKFSYVGNLGNSNRGNLQGVGHGEDGQYLFRGGSYADNASSSDVLTRNRMVRMWTNFAKTGNPTPRADVLLQNITWSVASSTKNLTYLDIGKNLVLDTNPNPADLDVWSLWYKNFGIPPYDTY